MSEKLCSAFPSLESVIGLSIWSLEDLLRTGKRCREEELFGLVEITSRKERTLTGNADQTALIQPFHKPELCHHQEILSAPNQTIPLIL
uniref:Uncharacterized protein n=1 Tax=Setaria digitata TaxID=48799 RepID=A0A915Q2B5_9BILA